MRFRRLIFSALCCFALTSLLAACSFDTSPGTSFAGQVCFEDADCAQGLACFERRCRPTGAQPADDGGTDADTGVDTQDDTSDDGSPTCQPGETRCQSASVVETCTDDGTWSEGICGDEQQCFEGQCVDIDECTDSDDDGYRGGPNCPDCNDSNPDINPGADEICGNGADDDCNGAIDDGCQTECCPGGCGDSEVCSVCECVPFDPDICTTTGQPCNDPGQFVNGFFCADEFFDQPRCVGVCDATAQDPNSTCPQDGTVCSFQQDDGQGLCLEGCSLDRGCSTDGFGCLPIDGNTADGICVPTDDNNQIGDPCDPDNTFACEAGAICLDLGQGQATCQQACRPFEFDDGTSTDCDSGHCFAFSADLGFCQQDADAVNPDGSCEQPQNAFRTCEEDATLCVNTGGLGGSRCFDLCRLDEGNVDCEQGQQCRETQQFDGVGFCTRGGGF